MAAKSKTEKSEERGPTMRNAILSWYAYCESGAAGRTDRPNELDNPNRVAELFADARKLDAELTPHGWRHLWSRYGLDGLIDLARGGGWPEAAADEEVAEALVSESLAGGYDPVSGQFGDYDDQTETFEPSEICEV